MSTHKTDPALRQEPRIRTDEVSDKLTEIIDRLRVYPEWSKDRMVEFVGRNPTTGLNYEIKFWREE